MLSNQNQSTRYLSIYNQLNFLASDPLHTEKLCPYFYNPFPQPDTLCSIRPYSFSEIYVLEYAIAKEAQCQYRYDSIAAISLSSIEETGEGLSKGCMSESLHQSDNHKT